MQKTKAAVDRVLEVALSVLMGVMVINVLWQVFSRYVLNDPSSFTDELARYLLIWLGLLAAAYGVGQRVHLAIDLFVRKRTGRARIYTQMFIEVCVLVFTIGAMIIGGSQLVSITLRLEQTSAALQVKLGYVYLILPLAGLVIVFYNIVFLSERWQALQRGDFDDEPMTGPAVPPIE